MTGMSADICLQGLEDLGIPTISNEQMAESFQKPANVFALMGTAPGQEGSVLSALMESLPQIEAPKAPETAVNETEFKQEPSDNGPRLG
ncbi:MAG: hypothetical protein KDI13_02550 [Alphaproteobacteria bacterium]|nr:hypothetical protein [Alphaproteobacteria bacterium]